jgi:hypothetical protein
MPNSYVAMRNSLLFLTVFTLLTSKLFAQIYIEPVAGYQLDIANRAKFSQINTGIQVSFKKGRGYELVARIQKSSPLVYHGKADSAFTPNTSLPLYESAGQTIHPGAWYFSVDHRFILNGSNAKQHFSVLLHTGVTYQNIIVAYDYDKNNYTVLNPEKTRKATSIFVGTGFEYMRIFKDNRVFFQITIDTPPGHGASSYPSSFSFMAPLAFNAGYSILIKKKKHEK